MLFAPLTKIAPQADGSLLVGGYASTADVDSDGEIIPDEVIKEALPDYLKYPTIRTMHRPNPVGKTVYTKQDGRGTWIEARVYDEQTKTFVKNGVLRAFSIGGSILARDKLNKKLIKKIRLTEISLVDTPANKSCSISMWKRAEPKLDQSIVRKVNSRPLMFGDLHKSNDVAAEPRDDHGRWTAGGSPQRDVVLEDRGTRRGKPWGTIAGAVAAGVAGAAVAARRPSRIAALLAGAVSHGAAGAAAGAVQGTRFGSAWPSKLVGAAAGAVAGAAHGAVSGVRAGAARPRLYNSLAGGALAGAAGAGVGGSVGEFVGAAHDRINTVRVVEKAEHPLVALAKFGRPSLTKFNPDHADDGKFTSSSHSPNAAAIAGGVAGGLAGDHLAHVLAHSLPAPAALAARIAGAAMGEVAGHHVGYLAGQRLFSAEGNNAAMAKAHHQSHADMIKSLKDNIRDARDNAEVQKLITNVADFRAKNESATFVPKY